MLKLTTEDNVNPEWWLYCMLDDATKHQIANMLGHTNFYVGIKQPNNNRKAAYWHYLEIYQPITENQKLLIEMLLNKQIVSDSIKSYK